MAEIVWKWCRRTEPHSIHTEGSECCPGVIGIADGIGAHWEGSDIRLDTGPGVAAFIPADDGDDDG